VKKSEKSNVAPPVCIKFYIQPPLSLVVIFPYAPPLVSQPPPPDNYCTVPKPHRPRSDQEQSRLRLCGHTDATMAVVRDFESKAAQAGRQSLMKDATREELRMQLTLEHSEPIGYTEEGDEIWGRNIGVWAKKT